MLDKVTLEEFDQNLLSSLIKENKKTGNEDRKKKLTMKMHAFGLELSKDIFMANWRSFNWLCFHFLEIFKFIWH